MALTKVTGDFIKAGVITQAHLHSSHGITSTHIAEGDKLFFTNARVDSRIGSLSTSNLSEGSNLYYTDARVASYLSTNSYATQSYVNTQVSNLVDSAPSTLDTLNELAAALGDDANFSTTVTNNIATKMPLAGGSFTGTVSIPSASHDLHIGNNLSTTGQIIFGLSSWNNSLGLESYWMVLRTNQNEGLKLIDSAGNTYVQFNASNNSSGAYDSTFKGDIITSGVAGDGTPLLTLTGSASATFNWISKSLHANLTAGETNLHLFGKAASTKNSGYIGYTWAGDGSNNNYVGIGQYSANHLFRVYGDQILSTVTLRSDVDMQAPIFYDKNNTSYYAHLDNTGTSIRAAGTVHASLSNMSAYQLNGTYIMDSSRNLVNIAAITASGDFNVGGVRIVGDNDSTDQGTAFIRSNGDYLVLNAADGEHVYLNWDSANGGSGHVYVDNIVYAQAFYDRNDTNYYVNPASTSNLNALNVGGSPVWTSGNDGSGSGLDADTLDGQHASAFLTSFTETNGFLGDGGNASTHPGTSRLIYSGQVSAGSGVLGMPTTNNANAFINLNKHSGEYNSQLGFSSDGNIYYRNFNNVAINNSTAFRKIWDSGNDGSGSGLDADLLDGSHASSFWTKSGSWYGDLGSYSYTREIGLAMTGGSEFVVLSKSGQGSVLVDGHYMAYESNNGFFGSFNSTFGNLTGIRASAANTLKVMQLDGGNAILEVTQDARAPIFYDSNNTAYYIDGASTSNLNTLQVADAIRTDRHEDISGNFMMRKGTNAGTTSGRHFNLADTTSDPSDIASSHTATGITWGQRTDNNPYYIIRCRPAYSNGYSTHSRLDLSWHTGVEIGAHPNYGGTRFFNNSSFTGSEIMRVGSGNNDVYINNIGTAGASLRAPEFYDSNNTGYYINPASLTNLYDLTLTGSKHTYLYINPGSGYEAMVRYNGGTGSTWYAGSRTSSDLVGSTDAWHVYSQTAGRTVSGTDTAGNIFAYGSVRSPIYYDRNDTTYYMNYFGGGKLRGNFEFAASDTATGYSTASIELRESNYTANSSATPPYIGFHWGGVVASNIAIESNGRIAIRNNPGNAYEKFIASNVYAASDFQGPIYYDSNNTAYYTDPATLSTMHSIKLIEHVNNTPRWDFSAYVVEAQHFYGNNGSQTMYLGESNHINIRDVADIHGNARAPIYYDRNNTNFYTRPSTSSLINTLYTEGTIQAGTSGTGNIYLGNNGGNGTGNHFRFHTNNSHTYFDGNCGDIHWRQGSSTRFYFYMTTANMTINGTLTQYSDERLKQNVVTIDNALNKVNQLRGVYYNRTDINTEANQIGLIAQETESVLPEVVHTANDELGTKSISYGQLNALLVEAIKEQQTIIDDLKSRIETLENQ